MKKELMDLFPRRFNNYSQVDSPDGVSVITISDRVEQRVYEFTVKDLNKDNEELLKQEVTDLSDPQQRQSFAIKRAKWKERKAK